jgi:pimeloyl-ACP methyl ester carboxylesterase
MKKNIKIIYISLIFIISACGRETLDFNVKDHFFLENDGAVMPIFVNGNAQSKIFLIYLHGGPGSTSLEAFQNKNSPFTKLQTDYAVVNWEQRCSGASQGNCSNLTISQYVEDLEKIIILLKNRYASDITIFLLGHSWGGSLGIKYLTTNTNQSNIKGWIEVGGGHDVPRIVTLEREMVNEIGSRQISQGNNINEWQTNISKTNSLNLLDVDDLFEMNRISVNCEQLMLKADSVNKKINNSYLNDYFFSPIDQQASNINNNQTFEFIKNELAVLNLSNKLSQITIPTLLLWGKYDFRVPPKFAQEALTNYGSSKKELVVFDRSAHFVQWNEPELFYEKVKKFIEQNK